MSESVLLQVPRFRGVVVVSTGTESGNTRFRCCAIGNVRVTFLTQRQMASEVGSHVFYQLETMILK